MAFLMGQGQFLYVPVSLGTEDARLSVLNIRADCYKSVTVDEKDKRLLLPGDLLNFVPVLLSCMLVCGGSLRAQELVDLGFPGGGWRLLLWIPLMLVATALPRRAQGTRDRPTDRKSTRLNSS